MRSAKGLFRFLGACYLLLILYWMTRLWGHFPAFMDTLEYVFPEKWFNVESFRQGRIPLWNPNLACGTPHLANLQSAAFYPLFWIWNWTGLTDWFFVLALSHCFLALGGFFLWLRSQKVSPLISLLGAMSFAGSALLVNYWGFPTHLASIAWIPWVFWAADRFLKKPSFSSGFWAALFWALQILAGYPFFTFYGFCFLAVCVRWEFKADGQKTILYLSVFLAALAVTACQWLPFLDFLGSLHREGRGEFLFNLRWKNDWTLLSPSFLGTPGTMGYKGDYPDFIFDDLYLGLVPLGLFILNLWPSAQKRTFFWKGAALFWFFWLAGIHFFPLRLISDHWLDVLEPAKASFLFIFCVFTSLAVNLQEKAERTSAKNPIWNAAWVLGAFWLLDLLWVPARIIQTVPDPYRNPRAALSAEKAKNWMGGGRLLSLRPQNNFFGEGGPSDSMAEAVRDLTPNTNLIWGLKSASGYLSIYTDGFQNFTRYLQNGFPYDGRVLDAAGVRLILCPQNLPAFKYQSHETQGDMVYTRNAGAMGKAWEADRVREFPDRASVFEALLNPNAFLENEVYTEGTAAGGSVLLSPVFEPLSGYEAPGFWPHWMDWGSHLWSPPEAQLDATQLSPGQARFQLSIPKRGGFLVFDESFAPGWHAWVDGVPKPIFRAYGLWMAVPLGEAGSHQVALKYEPFSFRLGLFVTLLSLGTAAGFAAKRFARGLADFRG